MVGLTVVIPTFNRSRSLHSCLDALASQETSESFEVVVVDDGSTDDTREMMDALDPRFPMRVHHQPNRGQAAALAKGVELARGHYCLFLDDDVVASPGLVQAHVTKQQELGGALVVGKLGLEVGARAGGLVSWFADWWAERYERLSAGEPPTFRSCYSGNLSAPRAAIVAAGNFAPDLDRSFDVELAWRLQQRGMQIVFAPHGAATQRYGKGFNALARDLRAAGRVSVELWRRHPAIVEDLPLGRYDDAPYRTLILLRLALTMRIPLLTFALLDRLLSSRPAAARASRFVHRYCYWRGVRSALNDREQWRRLTTGVAVLMYHAVCEPGEAPSRYRISPKRLAQQLAWLRLRRYSFLSLDDVVELRDAHTLPPPRSVVLTFDDGYRDFAAHALPVLSERDAPASVFVVTAASERNTWSEAPDLRGRPLLSWNEIAALDSHRLVTIGAHGRAHRRLAGLDRLLVEAEIVGSRDDLERRLEQPSRHFAYPYGSWAEQTAAVVAAAGFRTACTIEPGKNAVATPPFSLRRLEIPGTLPLVRFALTVALGIRPPPRYLQQAHPRG